MTDLLFFLGWITEDHPRKSHLNYRKMFHWGGTNGRNSINHIWCKLISHPTNENKPCRSSPTPFLLILSLGKLVFFVCNLRFTINAVPNNNRHNCRRTVERINGQTDRIDPESYLIGNDNNDGYREAFNFSFVNFIMTMQHRIASRHLVEKWLTFFDCRLPFVE